METRLPGDTKLRPRSKGLSLIPGSFLNRCLCPFKRCPRLSGYEKTACPCPSRHGPGMATSCTLPVFTVDSSCSSERSSICSQLPWNTVQASLSKGSLGQTACDNAIFSQWQDSAFAFNNPLVHGRCGAGAESPLRLRTQLGTSFGAPPLGFQKEATRGTAVSENQRNSKKSRGQMKPTLMTVFLNPRHPAVGKTTQIKYCYSN